MTNRNLSINLRAILPMEWSEEEPQLPASLGEGELSAETSPTTARIEMLPLQAES